MAVRRASRFLALAASGALVMAGAVVAVPAVAAPSVGGGEPGDVLREALTSGRTGDAGPGVRKSAPSGAVEAEAASTTQTPDSRVAVLDEFHFDEPPSNRQGVKQVRVTQNLKTRRVVVRATYRNAPTASADSVLYGFLGEWSGNQCHRRVALASEAVGDEKAGGFLSGEGPNYTVTGELGLTRTRSGSVVTLTSAADNRIKNGDWDCAFFDVTETDPADPSNPTFYQASLLFDLDEHYPPRLEMNLGDAVQGNYRTKWTKMRIEVRNNSLSPAPGVTITPKGAGLTFKPKKRTLGTIDDRTTKYGVEFKVRLKGKNPKKKQRKATFTAASAGKKFTQSVIIAEKPRPKKVKSLAGRYYWGFLPASSNVGWDNRGLWFVNKKWVHVGFTKNGAKPKCGKKVKACKRYTYNKRTGVVKFGGRKAKVNTEGFRIKAAKGDPAIHFYPTTLAKKGQKFKLELIRNDFKGNCLIFCTVWTEWLSMDKKGRFVLSRMSITSLGPPGTGSIFSSIPPDEKGRYQVQKNGRLVLNYANGTTKRHTLAIEHDVRGRASAQGAGVVLGDRNFYN